MKVCILSMQRVPNFGSLLQSLALKQLLEQQGHSVSFLDIEKNDSDNLLMQSCCNTPSFKISKVDRLIGRLKKIDKYAINRLRIRRLADHQNAEFDRFCDAVLGENAKTHRGHYDYCVIGSDEVFNCLAQTPWGFTSQLFGNVPQADQVITYAASCGATKMKNLPAPVAERIRQVFQGVKAFSVRDENTREFVAALSEKDVMLHADPVMISNFTPEIEKTPLPTGLPKRYCVVYSYYNRISDPQEIAHIKAFCKDNGLTPVTVGAPQMWIPRHLVLTPMEALKVMCNAEFIFTDTFHGTIFSAKYAKAFAVMTRASNENKLGDLLRRFSLEKHRVNSFDQVDAIENFQTDTAALAVPVQQYRDSALAYLETMIQ